MKRAVALLGLLLFLVAPAMAQARPVQSMLELRTQRVLIQNWDLSCGAAALATILRFEFGEPVTERDVALGLMKRDEYLDNPNIVRVRQGFSLLDMQRFVEKHNYVGEGLGQMSLDDLIARAPAIVPLTHHGNAHFVVFRGIMRDRVLVADPAFGVRTLPIRTFERLWRAHPTMGRVAFTVRRSGSEPSVQGLAPRPEEFLTFN